MTVVVSLRSSLNRNTAFSASKRGSRPSLTNCCAWAVGIAQTAIRRASLLKNGTVILPVLEPSNGTAVSDDTALSLYSAPSFVRHDCSDYTANDGACAEGAIEI